MNDLLEKFRDYLRFNGLRITRERDEILEVVSKSRNHFTATDIHQTLQLKKRGIGLATVYRTLPLLVKAGLIREADRRRCKEEQSYELILGDAHHDHLVCEICGLMIEFEEPMIEKLQINVAEKYGFRLRRHFLDLRGICSGCQKALMDKAVERI